MNKLVTKTLADCQMTPARKRELEKLAARPDSEIDLSDMPELTESFFKNAIRNPFYWSVTEEQTVRALTPISSLGFVTRVKTIRLALTRCFVKS